MFNIITFFLLSISPIRGALLSLIVPGLGLRQMGEDRLFLSMVAGELTLFSFYIYDFKTKGEIRESYKKFAYENASAFPGTDDERYWSAVENYYSYEFYYEYLLREARSLYPDEPLRWENYANANSVAYKWAWKDTTSWDAFLHKREKERRIESRMKILQGFVITYHLFSAIYTFVYIKKKKINFQIEGEIEPSQDKAYLKFTFKF
ncbi:MAG: hypothetical protein ABDH37_01325 [Candidatus Hydrothermales bacterium]